MRTLDLTIDQSVDTFVLSGIAKTILMIEPVAFGFNDQTAVNNYFQHKAEAGDLNIQRLAHVEFLQMVDQLRSRGIDVVTIKDTVEPHTPDSIFPNNWISFHQGGKVALYPMYAPNRRAERRDDVTEVLAEKGHSFTRFVDYTLHEEQNRFLEGTGSMILDRVNKIAYAAISERTDKGLFLQFCDDFGFKAVSFTANQTVAGKRVPIYHTNVLMCVGDRYVVICLDTIDDTDERKMVETVIKESGKDIVVITEEQMHQFAGNMLQVRNGVGEKFLAMSQAAYDSLSPEQIEQLTHYNEIIACPIPTIEKHGGGSVRCMMAEVF